MVFVKGHTPWSKGLTKETDPRLKKMGEKMRGENHPFYGKRRSEAVKGKISETIKRSFTSGSREILIGEKHPNFGRPAWNRGTPRSDETKRKISETIREQFASGRERLVGSKNPMYGMTGEKNPFYGRTHTEEAKNKVSVANTGRKFSEETKMIWRNQRGGDKNANWRGGIGNLPYSFAFNKELKELVTKRDEYTCQFPDCGVIEDLAIHHIDYDKMNSDPKNLATLCRAHNSKVNFNREYWEIYFTGEMV